MIQSMIAGIEIEHGNRSKTLSINIVNKQDETVGDVLEWLYCGTNSMIKVKTSKTCKTNQTSKNLTFINRTNKINEFFSEFPVKCGCVFGDALQTICDVLFFFIGFLSLFT